MIRGATTDRGLVCEVKSSGQPRIAREACVTLKYYVRSDSRDYPVFLAPYISPEAASICEGYDVGYLDLAGNCRLSFDQIYIRREGFPNPRVQKRDLRSLYSAKAERVLRVLLTAGNRTWRTQELADEAGVSLGQVANVKKLLDAREWIETERAGFGLRSFDAAVLPLLKEWAANYRSARNSPSDFYSLQPIPQVEAEMTDASRKLKMQLAFTGFSGAARLAPAVGYQRITVYVVGDTGALAQRLKLKPVAARRPQCLSSSRSSSHYGNDSQRLLGGSGFSRQICAARTGSLARRIPGKVVDAGQRGLAQRFLHIRFFVFSVSSVSLW